MIDADTIPRLVQQIEHTIGPISRGWSRDADGNKLPFQVVLGSGSPVPNMQVLSTLGLSEKPLETSGRYFRQEVVMMFRGSDGERNLPGLMQQVGMEAWATSLRRAVAHLS